MNLQTAESKYVNVIGDSMTGSLAMGTNKITGLGDATLATDALNRQTADNRYVNTSGDTMSGELAMGSNKITGLANPTATTDAMNKQTADSSYVNASGDTMSGELAMGTNKITGLGNATLGTDALNRQTADSRYVNTSGDSMTGDLAMGANKITGLADPVDLTDAINKQTADSSYVNVGGDTMSGALAMGTNKVTGLGDATADTDALNRQTADGRYLEKLLNGGNVDTNIVTVNIDGASTCNYGGKLEYKGSGLANNNTIRLLMDDSATSGSTRVTAWEAFQDGSVDFPNGITSSVVPTSNNDLTNKAYVDGLIGGTKVFTQNQINTFAALSLISFDTSIYTAGTSNWSGTTFTVPTTGFYIFKFQIVISGENLSLDFDIEQNSSVVDNITATIDQENSSSRYTYSLHSKVLSLSQGDAIEFNVNSLGGWLQSVGSYLNIEQV